MGTDSLDSQEENHGESTFVKVGEGKEFKVVRPADRSGVVLKIPKEQTAWANKDMSIPEYQETMANALREAGFAEYLPAFYREKDDPEFGKVIETVDLTDGGKNLVIAMEELDSPSPELIAKLRNIPGDPEKVKELVKKVRSDLFGRGGGGLVDNAATKKIAIGTDSYQLVVQPDGEVKVMLEDFGTVIQKNDWDRRQINEANYDSTIGLITRMGVLANIFDHNPPASYYRYEERYISGLPESYGQTIEKIVEEQVGRTGGIFLDVGGGTGELSKEVELKSGTKSLSLDYSYSGAAMNPDHSVVADAAKIPLPDGVVAVVHIKDVTEHLDDEKLKKLVLEAKRVLVDGGVLIITKKDYNSDLEKPEVKVSTKDGSWSEGMLPGETYREAAKRLRQIHGDELTTGTMNFPRTDEQVVQGVTGQGLQLKESVKWKPESLDPDWFIDRPSRNILIFTSNSKLPKNLL